MPNAERTIQFVFEKMQLNQNNNSQSNQPKKKKKKQMKLDKEGFIQIRKLFQMYMVCFIEIHAMVNELFSKMKKKVSGTIQ